MIEAIPATTGMGARRGGARLRFLGWGGWIWTVMILVGGGSLTACKARHPLPPDVPPPHIPPAQEVLVVPATRAVTNELRHVTYTFELPRRSTRGYVIQESRDGKTWSDLGRSTATNLNRITFVDATPSSGKQYRVSLP